MIVLVLQAVARERGNINYTGRFGGLRNRRVSWKIMKLQSRKLHAGSCTMEGGAAQHSRKVTVGVIVHDLTSRRWLRGVGLRHLRKQSLKIFHQNNINCQKLGGMVGFEFKSAYKLQVATQRKTLGILRIELLISQARMDREKFEALRARHLRYC